MAPDIHVGWVIVVIPTLKNATPVALGTGHATNNGGRNMVPIRHRQQSANCIIPALAAGLAMVLALGVGCSGETEEQQRSDSNAQPSADAAHTTPSEEQQRSNTNAQQIHMAMMIAAQSAEVATDEDRPLPDDIGALHRQGSLSIDHVVSPFADSSVPSDFGQRSESGQSNWLKSNASYIIVPNLAEDLDPDTIAVFLRPEHSDGSGITVTYNDNNTVWETDIEAIDRKLQEQTGMTMREMYYHRLGVRPVETE